MLPSKNINDLIGIMAALRTPVTGCPWDLEQSFDTIAPYTIEEAYEVADAIERGDISDLRDELGDLLLQVVFHARLAEEQGSFQFEDVVHAITSKLIRRHPHVFGNLQILTPEEVKGLWADIKAQEKADKLAERKAAGLEATSENASLLADIPYNLPALIRAEKLQAKASKVGFDWNDARLVLEKIREETGEIEGALASKDQTNIEEEIGDLLFVVANLARHLSVNPEDALRKANLKFVRRFNYIENNMKLLGKDIKDANLEEMEHFWNEARKLDKMKV
ncbi:MAG: nucleoside triphosphate pyrophosphohydrolase [Beijerinckiaceae bacterium]|nr:nucleoside triphosphate pyrophosphohydrolase [Beijerinckiaceae bacterium]